jgi:hypothetical protein
MYRVPDTFKGCSLSSEEKWITIPGEDASTYITRTVRNTTVRKTIHLRYLRVSLLIIANNLTISPSMFFTPYPSA